MRCRPPHSPALQTLLPVDEREQRERERYARCLRVSVARRCLRACASDACAKKRYAFARRAQSAAAYFSPLQAVARDVRARSAPSPGKARAAAERADGERERLGCPFATRHARQRHAPREHARHMPPPLAPRHVPMPAAAARRRRAASTHRV